MIVPVFDLLGHDLNYYQNYRELSDDPEDYNLCVARERWQEMEYSMDKFGAVYLYDGDRYWILHRNGKGMKISAEFLNGRLKSAFIRSSSEGDNLFRMMRDLSDVTNLTEEDYHAHRFWPTSVTRKFTKRNVCLMQNRYLTPDFLQSLGKFFLKSVEKKWSFAGTFDEWVESGTGYELELYSEDAYHILSDYMELDRDDRGTMEYRCFAVEERLTISRYEDYEMLLVPDSVRDFAHQFQQEKLGRVLPRDTVFDIGLSNGEPFLIEINNPCGSGRYAGNTVEGVFG